MGAGILGETPKELKRSVSDRVAAALQVMREGERERMRVCVREEEVEGEGEG